jgi:hypothetical protein
MLELNDLHTTIIFEYLEFDYVVSFISELYTFICFHVTN